MNNLRKILIAAIMMPFCMVAMDDGENGDDAGKPYLLAEVPGINSDMRPHVVESDFDLTGTRIIDGIPRHTESTPWGVLYEYIQYWPEDLKVAILGHAEQKEYTNKSSLTMEDAKWLIDWYGPAARQRYHEEHPAYAALMARMEQEQAQVAEKRAAEAKELDARLDGLPSITKILEELRMKRSEATQPAQPQQTQLESFK